MTVLEFGYLAWFAMHGICMLKVTMCRDCLDEFDPLAREIIRKFIMSSSSQPEGDIRKVINIHSFFISIRHCSQYLRRSIRRKKARKTKHEPQTDQKQPALLPAHLLWGAADWDMPQPSRANQFCRETL